MELRAARRTSPGPLESRLAGDPNHQILFGQQPEYLPELYVLLLPLGAMSFFGR